MYYCTTYEEKRNPGLQGYSVEEVLCCTFILVFYLEIDVGKVFTSVRCFSTSKARNLALVVDVQILETSSCRHPTGLSLYVGETMWNRRHWGEGHAEPTIHYPPQVRQSLLVMKRGHWTQLRRVWMDTRECLLVSSESNLNRFQVSCFALLLTLVLVTEEAHDGSLAYSNSQFVPSVIELLILLCSSFVSWPCKGGRPCCGWGQCPITTSYSSWWHHDTRTHTSTKILPRRAEGEPNQAKWSNLNFRGRNSRKRKREGLMGASHMTTADVFGLFWTSWSVPV